MKLSGILFLLFSATISNGQKIDFKVQYSEPLAVFEFVNHITEGGGNNPSKLIFQSSKYFTGDHKKLIEDFENINYFYWYEYPQYPYGSKIGGSTYFLLGKNLIASKTIDEFAIKSLGIIPNRDLTSMKDILTVFLPIYRELIFKPREELYKIQFSALQQKVKNTDISAYFNKVKHFLNSNWNNAVPFILSVCPQPKTEKSGFTATAFINYAISNIPVNETDYDLVLSVLFHESFHILYDEQSLFFKNEIGKWFGENPSKTSRYAELLFNEAVTTSLSSGYLYNQLSKTALPNDKWYNNKYINDMAVAMYPLVSEYLTRNKHIDKTFIDKFIGIYEKQFPQWIYTVDNVLSDRFIIAEDEADYKTITKKFRQRNIGEYENQLSPEVLQKIRKFPITKLIVIKKNNAASIRLIKQSFGELEGWTADPAMDFTYSVLLADKCYLVIINSVTKPISDLLNDITLK